MLRRLACPRAPHAPIAPAWRARPAAPPRAVGGPPRGEGTLLGQAIGRPLNTLEPVVRGPHEAVQLAQGRGIERGPRWLRIAPVDLRPRPKDRDRVRHFAPRFAAPDLGLNGAARDPRPRHERAQKLPHRSVLVEPGPRAIRFSTFSRFSAEERFPCDQTPSRAKRCAGTVREHGDTSGSVSRSDVRKRPVLARPRRIESPRVVTPE